MINLFISADLSMWESTPACFPRERCLTEYIMSEIKEQFSSLGAKEIRNLKKIPCIFAYEGINDKDAYVGCLNNITVRATDVLIDFRLTGDTIRIENNRQIQSLLDISRWEMNRTHWTIKRINIEQLKKHFSSAIGHKYTVFISYCWMPPENQRNVFSLVENLSNSGITVIYDKNSLRSGQDVNYFMEQSLQSNEIDKVLVICNKEYKEKADKKCGGVGYEAEIILSEIQSKPLQTRVIPVVIERNKDGEPFLPVFLKSRKYIDLNLEGGFDELVEEIKTTKDSDNSMENQ